MMSNISQSLTSKLQKQNTEAEIAEVSLICLDDEKGFDISATPSTPTPNTVIARISDKSGDPLVCDQSLPSLPSHEKSKHSKEKDNGEKYFVFSKFLEEHPSLSWAKSPEGQTSDQLDCEQSFSSLPSHEKSKHSKVIDDEEKYFDFAKFVKKHPSLAWAVSPEDKNNYPLDCDQSLPSLPSHEKSKHSNVKDDEEEYLRFSKHLEEQPSSTWASWSPENKNNDPLDCDQSLPSLPSHEKSKHSNVKDDEEEYLRFSKHLEEQPSSTWASWSPENKNNDPLDCDQSLPSLPSHEKSKHSNVKDDEEEYLRFSKHLEEKPSSTWASWSPENKTYDPRDCDQSLPSLPSHEKSKDSKVKDDEEKYFDFAKFLKKHPSLAWAASPEREEEEKGEEEKKEGEEKKEEGEEEESVAATMSPGALPALPSPQPVTPPDSEYSEEEPVAASMSSSAILEEPITTTISPSAPSEKPIDTTISPSALSEKPIAATLSDLPVTRDSNNILVIDLSKITLRKTPHPIQSMKISEMLEKTSHLLPGHSLVLTKDKQPEQPFKQPEPIKTTLLGKRRALTGKTTSAQRIHKRNHSEPGPSTQSTFDAPERHLTQDIDTGLGDLDVKSALFLAKQQISAGIMPLQLHKTASPHTASVPSLQSTTTLDRLSGIVKMDVLRDAARLNQELWRDAKAIGYRTPGTKKPCPCNVDRHPSSWSVLRIQDVHNYSFLLDCQNLEFKRDTMLAANKSETIVVHDIPMNRQNPLKLKAEQVLRYMDVEVGIGDQTYHDLFYYKQPEDRRILMVVSRHRQVVGMVVAEKLLNANRILRETRGYMELEEDPVPVRVGINRLWVHVSMRRQHLATLLCQLVAKCFYQDETLQVEDFAFNDISPVMVTFAKVYLKTSRPPLYYHER